MNNIIIKEMEQISLKIVDEIILQLNKNGFVFSGHNGPYLDFETPLRNTSHSILVLKYFYLKTRELKYFNAIEKATDYLLKESHYPMDKTAIMRTNELKDKVNGVIGSAWLCEGLVHAFSITKNLKTLSKAEKIFLSLPFESKHGLWSIVEVDGKNLGIDLTFNHQLWFLATGVELIQFSSNPTIIYNVNNALLEFSKYFRIHPNGLIKHLIRLDNNWMYSFKESIKYVLRPKIKDKEKGYQLFNLYAFATIYNYYPSLKVFKSIRLKKAIKLALKSSFYTSLIRKSNPYAFGYNAPGFELPYILKTFNQFITKDEKLYKEIQHLQIDQTWGIDFFDINTKDYKTLSLRIYELLKLSLGDKNGVL